MNAVTFYITDLIRRLHDEEEGLALTEYLVVLGLLIGGVILAVLTFGENLANAWEAWGAWIQTNLGSVPEVT